MAWVEIPHGQKLNNLSFIAVSDTGMLLRKNGEVVPSSYRQKISCGGKFVRVYQLIADHFLVSARRPDQTQVDHVTHNPEDMNINDVRNLRWCTCKENNNFVEHRETLSCSKKGCRTWNKGLTGIEYVKHFKNGVNNQYTKGVKLCGQL